jgi:hypothetical protein
MPEPDRKNEEAVREKAYFIWLREGRPRVERRITGYPRQAKGLARHADRRMFSWTMKRRFSQAARMQTCLRC